MNKLPVWPTSSLVECLDAAKKMIDDMTEAGKNVCVYTLALDMNISEFHFAREFRGRFGISAKQYHIACRIRLAQKLLSQGLPEGEVARRVCLRRPAELRRLLNKHPELVAVDNRNKSDEPPVTVRATPNSIAAPATA